MREAWEEAGLKPGDGDDMVRAISWKVISDGSNQGRTGYLREPYLASDQRGTANCSAEAIVNHWGATLRDHILGPERAGHLDRVASALRHGLRPSFHSDYNVSPISPLQAVQTAVTRSMEGGGTLNPAECIGVAQALRAVTIDAAWQTHTDDVLGSLTPGKYADLVVLSSDPRSVDPSAIAEIAVHETRLGGAVAWSAE